jgi:hypothetical protein
MRTKKPAGLVSPSGLLKLAGHTAMGVAMGLGLALLITVIDPSGIAALGRHGGSQAIIVFVGTLVLTFGIGATLTGTVFIMTEDH